jgi:excisionase family DNA binding protein
LRRDHLIDSLIAQLDVALVELQTARKVAAELRREADVLRRASTRGRDAVVEGADASLLRYSGMTVAEAARALGVGEEQVRRLLRRSLLSGVQFGGSTGWRLPRAEVEAVAAEWSAQRRAHDRARRTTAKRPRS